MDKRSFIKGMAMAGIGIPFTGSAMDQLLSSHDRQPATMLAADEVFWSGIRSGYKLKPEYCNLENGYYNLLPEEIRQTAIYTKTDGIVDWKSCVLRDADKNFEVTGTHIGLAFNFQVYKTIAARLASEK